MATYGIVTRYAGPTNYRGSRIIARGPSLRSGGRQTRAVRPYDYAADGTAAVHRPAALAVLETLRADGWRVTLAPEPVALPDDSGYLWPLRHESDPAHCPECSGGLYCPGIAS